MPTCGHGPQACYTKLISKVAETGHVAMMEEFIAAGLMRAPDTVDVLLQTAAGAGNVDMCRLLLRHGADINAGNQYGFTPLMFAIIDDAMGTQGHVTKERLAVGRMLIANGCDVNTRTIPDDETPLHLAFEADVCQMLLDANADVGAVDRHASTPLHTYAECAALPALWTLVRHGADYLRLSGSGSAPEALARATYSEEIECIATETTLARGKTPAEGALIRRRLMAEAARTLSGAAFLAEVTRCGGWHAYVAEGRLPLVRLRYLVECGRATLRDGADGAVAFIFDQMPRELFRDVVLWAVPLPGHQLTHSRSGRYSAQGGLAKIV